MKLFGGQNPAVSPLGVITHKLGSDLLDIEDGILVTQTTTALLLGASSSDQIPGAADTPIQVEFGAPQATPVIDLDVSGNVTFLQTDEFGVRILLNFGRDGGGPSSTLFGRVLLNGIQIGPSLGTEIDDSNDIAPLIFVDSIPATASDVLSCEIYTDGIGGLFNLVSGLGWNDAPSAEIQIVRSVVTAT